MFKNVVKLSREGYGSSAQESLNDKWICFLHRIQTDTLAHKNDGKINDMIFIIFFPSRSSTALGVYLRVVDL